jgi:hypothetical protein
MFATLLVCRVVVAVLVFRAGLNINLPMEKKMVWILA